LNLLEMGCALRVWMKKILMEGWLIIMNNLDAGNVARIIEKVIKEDMKGVLPGERGQPSSA